ncbi:heavy metal-responsive transcriptional regulator [Pyxidicoccus fallax]|uniref:Heavy metal-responsive transcriptional regulator n=1 Tax=Pyxidicoccus fallax TaxID=394095 RepID=A0A848M0W1_9BACT|nr:heavy metal-responsive transcriptional regulator [Pyxidicoccus fallax]NMO23509.1 heavy metal-responsive transcriptional regulator [Pyxidicoccus fallax]NPC86967.1 heavy metal-responsive transcriptional regulator [Pyxidicoccus fallax]
MSTRVSRKRPEPSPTLRISELARAAGVGIPTLRFYERKKLLPAPERTESGYRLYEPHHVTRVRFIRRAQELGFSLKEVGSLLAMSDGKVPSSTEVERFAAAKLDAIDARVKDLQRMKRAILKLMAEGICAGAECPVIASLGGALATGAPARRARN